eukprot:4578010-Amphidinium_carterae.1
MACTIPQDMVPYLFNKAASGTAITGVAFVSVTGASSLVGMVVAPLIFYEIVPVWFQFAHTGIVWN